VASPREQDQATSRLFAILRLGQNAPTAGNDRIRTKNEGKRVSVGHHASLGLSEPKRVTRRKFALEWGLIDCRGIGYIRQ
jgi:hypothetical protein